MKNINIDCYLDDQGGCADTIIHNGSQTYEVLELKSGDSGVLLGQGVANITDTKTDEMYSMLGHYVRRGDDNHKPVDDHLFIMTRTNLSQPLPDLKKYKGNAFVQFEMEEIGEVDADKFLAILEEHARDAVQFGKRAKYVRDLVDDTSKTVDIFAIAQRAKRLG